MSCVSPAAKEILWGEGRKAAGTIPTEGEDAVVFPGSMKVRALTFEERPEGHGTDRLAAALTASRSPAAVASACAEAEPKTLESASSDAPRFPSPAPRTRREAGPPGCKTDKEPTPPLIPAFPEEVPAPGDQERTEADPEPEANRVPSAERTESAPFPSENVRTGRTLERSETAASR